jgi:hypothetical protein
VDIWADDGGPIENRGQIRRITVKATRGAFGCNLESQESVDSEWFCLHSLKNLMFLSPLEER